MRNLKILGLALIISLGLSCSKDEEPAPVLYRLTTQVTPVNSGELSISSGEFEASENIELKATPASGFVFSGWSGDLSGTANPVQLRMTSNKNITATFTAEEADLAAQIIGKWDVATTSAAQGAGKQQSAGACKLFSLVFRPDRSFAITTQQNELTGTYSVQGSSAILLKDTGSLSNVSVSGNNMSFEISLTGGCASGAEVSRDVDYELGDCFSFLHCYHDSYWKLQEGSVISFLRFLNQPGGLWMEQWTYDSARNCRLAAGTLNSSNGSLLLANHQESLGYTSGEVSGSFKIADNGSLLWTRGTDAALSYTASTRQELEAFSGFEACPARTYVPDDSFETELIQRGYDDKLDDYVLTENIASVKTLFLSRGVNYITENFTSLTGIEDFVALEELEVQSGTYTEVDLSKNVNLRRLRLWDAPLTEVDISANTELFSVFFDGLQIIELDISKNTKLMILDVSRSPLKTLDITNNPLLESLVLEGDAVETLITKANPNLKLFQMNRNPLSRVDLSLYPNLETLYLGHSSFDQVDISANPKLRSVVVAENPQLHCLQVNADQLLRFSSGEHFISKDEHTDVSLDCNYSD